MHDSSKHHMRLFVEKYLDGEGRVLDVGALDINGSYRDLFQHWRYVGADRNPGKNVDVILGDKWQWKAGSFDAVISGQTLEHVEDDVAVVGEMVRVLKKGGNCCIIVPSAGPKHNEPDYRRYTEESLSGLMEGAGLKIIECYKVFVPLWFDIVAIGRKH